MIYFYCWKFFFLQLFNNQLNNLVSFSANTVYILHITPRDMLICLCCFESSHFAWKLSSLPMIVFCILLHIDASVIHAFAVWNQKQPKPAKNGVKKKQTTHNNNKTNIVKQLYALKRLLRSFSLLDFKRNHRYK